MALSKWFLPVSLLCTVALFAGSHKDHEWQSLPSSNDLSEFTIEDGVATYVLEDGVITGTTVTGSPNTFLATKEEYGDFELTFEAKVNDRLNSGIQIRSRNNPGDRKHSRDNNGRYHGPQVELEASPGQSGFIYGEAMGTGWLYPSKDEMPRNNLKQHNHFKNGEWNTFRILAQGARIQTFINGIQISDYTDEAVYAKFPKGSIGFQVHSVSKKIKEPLSVSWRNIKVRKLPAK